METDTAVNTSDEACAVICMLVSNPQAAFREDGDGWQRRANDLIRALRDERNDLEDSADAYCKQMRIASDKCAQFSDALSGLYSLMVSIVERTDTPDAAKDALANSAQSIVAGNLLQPKKRLEWPKF